MGWCFGGGWALNASIAEPVDATVVYYGRVDKPADQLAKLKGPVLGHFATRDEFIDEAMVGSFEKAMAEAGKPVTVYWYEADHAFANPSGGRYDEADAALAWSRTMEFLRQTL
jgi:carboxymethylenebutenolidase